MPKKPGKPKLVYDYKDHPKSVTEVRATKSNKASDCLPRDALIETLREIDGGKLKLKHLILVMAEEIDGSMVVSYNQAGSAGLASVGLMHEVIVKMCMPR